MHGRRLILAAAIQAPIPALVVILGRHLIQRDQAGEVTRRWRSGVAAVRFAFFAPLFGFALLPFPSRGLGEVEIGLILRRELLALFRFVEKPLRRLKSIGSGSAARMFESKQPHRAKTDGIKNPASKLGHEGRIHEDLLAPVFLI